jgi:hypothetical protein
MIPIEDEHLYSSTNTPQSFYFRGDKVILVPTPSAADKSLELWWSLAPSKIVTLADAALVQSVSTDSVVCTGLPSYITAGATVDFVQGRAGCSIRGMDAVVSNVVGNQVDFVAGTVPTDLVAGDYISLYQTSPVIMLPDEVYPLLESLTCQQIMSSLGDFEAAKELEPIILKQEKAVKLMMEPRVQGEEKKIVNRNGLLRGARGIYRNGWLFR